jgi:hypothetical protein
MTTSTYSERINALENFGYENNLELWITERDNHLHFTIDDWNTGDKVEGSYPIEGSTFALNMSFIRARMEAMIEEAK